MKTRLLAFVLTLTICCISIIPVLATDQQPVQHEHEEAFCEGDTANATTSPYAYTFCECGGRAILKCRNYHYGYAGTLFESETCSSTCTLNYYRSEGIYVCLSCGLSERSGMWHDCYKLHSACGKGRIQECALVISGV